MLKCKICNSSDTDSIYKGRLRSGSFGKQTTYEDNVLLCNNCKTIFLQNTKLKDDFYESDEYRASYNETFSKQDICKKSNGESERRLKKITMERMIDKVVIDIGAGPGIFLDLASSVAKETIAIEPALFYHEELQKRHKAYPYTKELIRENKKGDIVCSFNVIEHIADPLTFLKDKNHILSEEGTMYLITPNHDDILMQTIPEAFAPFYYRTAHLFYFNEDSISYILGKAGFKEYKIKYMHTMDISNMMLWLKEHRPTGLGKFELFDQTFNGFYQNYLEDNKLTNYLWIEAKK